MTRIVGQSMYHGGVARVALGETASLVQPLSRYHPVLLDWLMLAQSQYIHITPAPFHTNQHLKELLQQFYPSRDDACALFLDPTDRR